MDSFCYILNFYYYAFRGIFRNQDLQLPSPQLFHKNSFQLSERIYDEWKMLFNAKNDTAKIPFTYYWPEYIKFYLKAMDKLRFNYRNVLHLGHHSCFTRNPRSLQLDEKVNVLLEIKDIGLLDNNRAVILIICKIEDCKGAEISNTCDFIAVRI